MQNCDLLDIYFLNPSFSLNYLSNTTFRTSLAFQKLDGVAPLIADPPPQKLHTFSKMVVTFKPLMRF